MQGISPISVSNDKLRQLLLEGNVFQNDKKVHLKNVITQIQNGNKRLYQQFVIVIIEMLKQNNKNIKVKQIAFDHITELAVTANHQLINQLNKHLFSRIPEFYDEKDGLGDYISLWKQMYNGKSDSEGFPNLSKTLQEIQTPKSAKLSAKLQKFSHEFTKNLQKLKQKTVQFFQDFDDSQITESFIDEHQMIEIIYMDIVQIKQIRQRVQRQKLTEQNCAEYLLKMKTFVNLNPTSIISADLLREFNKQKIWAKHFIDHHQEYLIHNSQQQQLVNNPRTRIGNIYLDKEQQSMQIPQGNLHKGNFTIHQLSVDQSRLTQKSSKSDVQIMINNNSKLNGIPTKQQIKNSVSIYDRRSSLNVVYQKKLLHQVLRPTPEDTLLIQESTLLNNISIPLELTRPVMKSTLPKNTTTNRFSQFPNTKPYTYNDNLQSFSSSKLALSSSNNNPFANSKTNYNQLSNLKINYQQSNPLNSKQKKIDILHSPIRNRMSEDDLDSDNLADELIVKPYYYHNLAFSSSNNNNKRQNQNLFTKTHHYAKTQLNFYPQNDKLRLNLQSKQYDLYSQQISPKSEKSNKTRLSKLTSQKKKQQRKTKGYKQNNLNTPQEYAFRPYSMHFRNDTSNYYPFRRNCLQQTFPIYITNELVITCKLRKVKQSRVEVDIIYENQLQEQLSLNILYKIPKSLKIEKVSKIHRKFYLDKEDGVECHKFNLKVVEFPLEMCFLELTYTVSGEQDQPIVSAAHLPLPITIKNFIQTLPSNRQQLLRILNTLTSQTAQQPYIIEKTFEIDRDVVDPSSLQAALGKEFIKIGVSEGYSVEEFGCICHYKEFNNLMFLLRIAVRVDHVATLSIITENRLTNNEKDFLNYFMDILLTIFAKYSI